MRAPSENHPENHPNGIPNQEQIDYLLVSMPLADAIDRRRPSGGGRLIAMGKLPDGAVESFDTVTAIRTTRPTTALSVHWLAEGLPVIRQVPLAVDDAFHSTDRTDEPQLSGERPTLGFEAQGQVGEVHRYCSFPWAAGTPRRYLRRQRE
jgi:hypothetical protein